MMKLLGYVRIKGTNKDGKPYDDYRLYIQEDNIKPNEDAGGIQVAQVRTAYGSYFPKISPEKFNELVKAGLSIGSEIECYKDMNNKLVVKLV